MHKISIITPTFNQANFLEKTIDSVLSQNYANLEYMIIDGGSTDGSVEIIKRYAKHLAYWVSEPDHGQSHAINKGLKRATGDVINWLNSDDYYEPNAFEIVSEVFQNSQITCFCGRSRIFQDDETIKLSNGTDVYLDNIAKTIGWARIDQPETFFSKVVWDQLGLLNQKLHYTMDRELWIRYLFHFGLKGVEQSEEVLVNFRHHENSKSCSAQEKFDQEWDSLIYALCNKFNFKKLALAINSNGFVNPELSILSNDQGVRDIEPALHYYALKKADQCYYLSEYGKSKAYLACVDSDMLDQSDVKLYRNLGLKLRIPYPILNLLR